jgi:hypothetical protein
MSIDTFLNLDVMFDDFTLPEAEAILKMIQMLQEAKVDPKDWVRLTALGIAAWEFPSVREIIDSSVATPSESPDTLDMEDLRHRQDVCLDPPGDQP